MPYIAEEQRVHFRELDKSLMEARINTAGELQYVIALAIAQFMSDKPARYQQMNDVMGALNGANLEFYRRHVAPYEDYCIRKNGDIDGYGMEEK